VPSRIRGPRWTTWISTRASDDSVTIVEWGEGLVEQLVDAYLEVAHRPSWTNDSRVVELVGHGGELAG
jgi:tRNA threonylcarbamoyladenosine biosynthesis protein TsaE